MTLSSHRRKLDRAMFHTDNVEKLVASWSTDGLRLAEHEGPGGLSVLFAQQVEPLPEELPLAVGDALQCLRNSLDHLVFALAKKGTPTLTPEQEHIPEFPIGSGRVAGTDRRITFLRGGVRADATDGTGSTRVPPTVALEPDEQQGQAPRDPPRDAN